MENQYVHAHVHPYMIRILFFLMTQINLLLIFFQLRPKFIELMVLTDEHTGMLMKL